MRKPSRSLTAIVLSTALTLLACGGGGSSSGGQLSQSKTRIATLVAADFTSNNRIHSVSVFSDGSLSKVSGSPYLLNGSPNSVVITSNRLAYVAENTGFNSGSIQSFRISADGELASAIGPYTTNLFGPMELSLTLAGNLLLVNNGSSTPLVLGADINSGSLTQIGGLNQGGVATISPDGKFVFSVGDSEISSYSLDVATGSFTFISSASGFFETRPTKPIIHPSGKFLYVPYASGNIIGGPAPPGGIAAFAIADDGKLTPVAGSPFALGTNFASPVGPGFEVGVIQPSGSHIYAHTAGSVYGFTIDQGSGALTAIPSASGFAAGTPTALVFDPSGHYLFVAHAGGISSYSISADGSPTLSSGGPLSLGQQIVSMATVP
jgi:6-phosphogluconolactonase (cycloisomerase 2 family)